MKRNPFADKFSTTKIKSLHISLTTYYMGDKLAYKMYYFGKLLFKGEDFKPSILRNWDSIESNIDLLSFLSIGIHDTDIEYFANYTQIQLLWANDQNANKNYIGTREVLSGLVSDASDINGEYYKEAIKSFKHRTY